MSNVIHVLTHSFLDGYNQRFDRVFCGGLERYVYDLCCLLKELGYQPIVHQLSYYDSFQREYDGIVARGYPYDLHRPHAAFEKMAEGAPGRTIYASFIWHPMRYRPGSLAICHGINWDLNRMDQNRKKEVGQAIQGALDQLNQIVSVDSHFLSYCRSVCSYSDPDQIVVIPNSVDTNRFVPGDFKKLTNEFRILFPRRLSHERGLIPMMSVADALLKTEPRLTIEFAGELIEGHSLAEAFSIWRENHPLGERILHSAYSFEQVIQAYQQADLVVIPTVYSEGTSYACLEALSCGKPIVATNVGGLNDLIIDGYNGRLVPPTPEHLLRAVRQLIDDDETRLKFAERARNTAQAFDKKIWDERWKRVLRDWLDQS